MFGKKKDVCCICQQNIGTKKIANGVICYNCFARCGPFVNAYNLKTKTPNQISEAMILNERNMELASKFNSTKHIEKYFDIDENNKLWNIPCFLPQVFFTYDNIISFELLENGNAVTKGGLGSVVVGGTLFGGVGAIVGSNIGKKKTVQEITEYRIKIVTQNPFYPEIYINFLATGKTKSNSILFKSCAASAQKILSLLTIITSNDTKKEISSSSADEILKFKHLLDEGIITQEEFDSKKQQLLNQ